MAEARTPLESPRALEVDPLNVADRLHAVAAAQPTSLAVACPLRLSPGYRRERRGAFGNEYATTTFAQLDADASRIASGLIAWDVPPGTRLALLIRPGIEFVTLVFALLRAGMVTVLIDPGMGRRNALRRLAEAEPEGFIAGPTAQVLRILLRRNFPRAKWNVTVGRRWGWGVTLDQLRSFAPHSSSIEHPASSIQVPDSPAAIIFTSGSTGPAKGVLYTHRMFDTQVSEIQSTYGLEPGGIDLSCFPLFALFNSAMGVTTVMPDMDFSRPAAADPKKLLAAANDWRVTQAFASPAVWRKLSDHCRQTGERIESLRQVFSCGAPVPAVVLRSTLTHVAPKANMHTPYGATECLPVATIEAAEVLRETAEKTDQGAGICVGRPFGSIDWKVIRITDEPIASIDDVEELSTGEIGELIVRGPQASPHYVTRTECNADSKILDAANSAFRIPHSAFPWHRMGDVGYLDEQGRFWYCGRKSHRVETARGPLFTECVEAIFDKHPAVYKSALVGLGDAPNQAAAICILATGKTALPAGDKPVEAAMQLTGDHPLSEKIAAVIFVPDMPVDVRHNSKIIREVLRDCAAEVMRREPPSDFVFACAESPSNRLDRRPPFASARKT